MKNNKLTPVKLKLNKYEKKLNKLLIELCKLQSWLVKKGVKVIVIFKGRDGAGKGGTIKALTEKVSPRIFRTVALPAPSEKEQHQLYMQHYVSNFPTSGEVVIFVRSWYNRAGVEHVMDFCTKEQHERFLQVASTFEGYLIDGGIILIKYWLEVSSDEQARRFESRITHGTKQWKLSPMDLPSRSKWYQYSKARDEMLEATDTKGSPWYIIHSNDKKRAHLNCIAHFLQQIPYKDLAKQTDKIPKRSSKGKYDDIASIAHRRFVPEVY